MTTDIDQTPIGRSELASEAHDLGIEHIEHLHIEELHEAVTETQQERDG